MKNRQKGEAAGTVLGLMLVLAMIAAWLTHVLTCIDTERWGFLIAGAIFFSVAIIHGLWIWFT